MNSSEGYYSHGTKLISISGVNQGLKMKRKPLHSQRSCTVKGKGTGQKPSRDTIVSGTGTEIKNLARDSSGTGTGWKMAGTGRKIAWNRSKYWLSQV